MTATAESTIKAYDLEDLADIDNLEIKRIILNNGNHLVVNFPLSNVGCTNDPCNIALDYIDASYFGECMAKLSSEIEAEPVARDYGMIIRFTMSPMSVDPFLTALKRLVLGFIADDRFEDGVGEELFEYADEILDRKLALPLLGDNYLANFLAGSIFLEEKEEWLQSYPSWQWNLWRSFASDKFNCEFYTSDMHIQTWIVLDGFAATQKLLAEYGGSSQQGAQLYDASYVKIENSEYLITAYQAIKMPMERIGNAIDCWQSCLVPKDKVKLENTSWKITEDGNAAIYGDNNVSFVAFLDDLDRNSPEETYRLLTCTEHTNQLLRELVGLNEMQINWGRISPELFEELCYDILFRSNGAFDKNTLRKHGRTCSRDGGRDIEVWTRSVFGKPIEKWIYQCKFIKSNHSLSGRMLSISDVIDQYCASGFGIMTNEIIDSTLYDKIDAISHNRGIKIDVWDKKRIEHFITARKDLLNRYFPVANAKVQEKENFGKSNVRNLTNTT